MHMTQEAESSEDISAKCVHELSNYSSYAGLFAIYFPQG